MRECEEDARKIAGLGLDHIRLPIDEEQMWNEAGAREPEAWDLMNACLDWCEQEGLRVVVDAAHGAAPPLDLVDDHLQTLGVISPMLWNRA